MIPESELILNPDGTIYHLNLLPDHISDTILTVGDPARVAQVSRHFDSIEFEGVHREFVTHVGYYRGKRLTVLSTGMGTDNIDIVMNELDALVNIDFMSRTVRPPEERLSLRIIRLGTSGSLQPDVPVGALLATQHAVGLDSLMQFYPLVETGLETRNGQGLAAAPGPARRALRGAWGRPTARAASRRPAHRQHRDLPRLLRASGPPPAPRPAHARLHAAPAETSATRAPEGNFRLSNFEMETAGYYALGQLLGHQVL
ncbi:MAG: phosphorylase [Hymenobacter sp.]